jgi:hypothetical protein
MIRKTQSQSFTWPLTREMSLRTIWFSTACTLLLGCGNGPKQGDVEHSQHALSTASGVGDPLSVPAVVSTTFAPGSLVSGRADQTCGSGVQMPVADSLKKFHPQVVLNDNARLEVERSAPPKFINESPAKAPTKNVSTENKIAMYLGELANIEDGIAHLEKEEQQRIREELKRRIYNDEVSK